MDQLNQFYILEGWNATGVKKKKNQSQTYLFEMAYVEKIL